MFISKDEYERLTERLSELEDKHEDCMETFRKNGIKTYTYDAYSMATFSVYPDRILLIGDCPANLKALDNRLDLLMDYLKLEEHTPDCMTKLRKRKSTE